MKVAVHENGVCCSVVCGKLGTHLDTQVARPVSAPGCPAHASISLITS